ncbi:OPT super [Blastocladiella emersonii ATCC 22665]|nr:OPT super [Blastocladiella emersonii ATCC 22665]
MSELSYYTSMSGSDPRGDATAGNRVGGPPRRTSSTSRKNVTVDHVPPAASAVSSSSTARPAQEQHPTPPRKPQPAWQYPGSNLTDSSDEDDYATPNRPAFQNGGRRGPSSAVSAASNTYSTVNAQRTYGTGYTFNATAAPGSAVSTASRAGSSVSGSQPRVPPPPSAAPTGIAPAPPADLRSPGFGGPNVYRSPSATRTANAPPAQSLAMPPRPGFAAAAGPPSPTAQQPRSPVSPTYAGAQSPGWMSSSPPRSQLLQQQAPPSPNSVQPNVGYFYAGHQPADTGRARAEPSTPPAYSGVSSVMSSLQPQPQQQQQQQGQYQREYFNQQYQQQHLGLGAGGRGSSGRSFDDGHGRPRLNTAENSSELYNIYESYSRTRDETEQYKPTKGKFSDLRQAGLAEIAAAAAHDSTKSGFIVDEDFERVVQDIVPTTDHPETPSLTFRVWILGTFFCVLLGMLNQLFLFRTNYFAISSYVGILLAYPLGKLMERYVPSIRLRAFGTTFDTNPGPFTVKEHVLIGIFGSTGASGVYGTENLVVQETFFNMTVNPLYSLTFLFATSLLGFALSGPLRRFTIRPIQMIWPTVLPVVSVYSAFHRFEAKATENDGKKHWSQLGVFFLVVFLAFVYHLAGPGYLAPLAGTIPLLCFIAPKTSTWLHELGSPMQGVGLLSFSLDWSVISGSAAMSSPFWASASMFFGGVVLQWVVAPMAKYQRWFGEPQDKLVLNVPHLIDKNGDRFSARKYVDKQTLRINEKEYQAKSPIYMSPLFAISYFAILAQFTAAISHVIAWYGRDIVRRLRNSRRNIEEDDVHCQLIDQYPEVPNTVYFFLFVVVGVLLVLVCQIAFDSEWWATLLAVGVAIIGVVPVSIVLATTGTQLGINVPAELVIGLIAPGRPILMMTFKAIAYSVVNQCITLLMDLKLGHYMKIPPRHVFISQISAQIIAVGVCYVTMRMWVDNPVHQDWIMRQEEFKKENGTASYNAALIWGAIGPKRFFFESAYGPVVTLGFAAGAVTPIIFKLADVFLGGPIPWKYIQGPLLFLVPGVGSNQGTMLSTFLVAAFFQFFMYRYRQDWWSRYNYVVASAADVGTGVAVLFTYLVLAHYLPAPIWFLNQGEGASPNPLIYGSSGDFCGPFDAPEKAVK